MEHKSTETEMHEDKNVTKTRMSPQQNSLKLNQNNAPTWSSALSSLTADVTLVGVDTYA